MNNFKPSDDSAQMKVSSHPRLSEFDKLVYPVVSRRSGGLSLGVNLNPDKKCSFRCVYCQVDRALPVPAVKFSTDQVKHELEEWLNRLSESKWEYENHPLKDISIAGDGEPTSVGALPEVLNLLVDLKKHYKFDSYKLILFSNGYQIDRPDLSMPLANFFQNGGEIWYKLDCWHQNSLKQINRTRLAFDPLIQNLILMGKKHPVVIQSCLFRWAAETFNEEKYQSYIKLLDHILKAGTQIKLLQLYTLARSPAENQAQPWSDEEMDRLNTYIANQVNVKTEVYYTKGKQE